MHIPGALVVAAGLMAGALVVSGHGQAQSRPPEAAKAASAPPSVVGRYLLVASGQDAWRIDTATGDVHYCVYKSNRVICDK